MSAAGVERPSSIRSVKALPGAASGKHFDPYFQSLAERPAWRCEGRIVEALGQSVRSEGPLCQLGETCEIVDSEGNRHLGEVIGFRGNQVLSMPLDRVPSIRYGNIVAATGLRPRVGVGDSLRGRVLNALGKPIDGGPPLRTTSNWELDRPPLAAMDR
jgi:flagellum-specific ATP synthase